MTGGARTPAARGLNFQPSFRLQTIPLVSTAEQVQVGGELLNDAPAGMPANNGAKTCAAIERVRRSGCAREDVCPILILTYVGRPPHDNRAIPGLQDRRSLSVCIARSQ